MNTTDYCQSCGIPMGETNELYGTKNNRTKSEDYCKYCFEDGNFTADVSMDEMIEICVPHMISVNENMSKDEARKMMKEFFPNLKRWKNK
ncbi:zinc ribbon domain-containing protein [Clostridiaceae bacterium M8S5]|nr:zinc ribbon domain-containing protein [Clostridiaceae bacterium M8S5]